MSEEDLCRAFIESAREDGWTAHPEWGGWDIFLLREGVQVGVEAKLSAGIKVLSQALSPSEYRSGPAFHAVLVPKASPEFCDVARALRINVFTPKNGLHWPLPKRLRWNHTKPSGLPPVPYDVPAGVPSPVRLTSWKVKAIRLWVQMTVKGEVTIADFKSIGLDPKFFRDRWIRDSGRRDGRRHIYVPIEGDHPTRPDNQHPDVFRNLMENHEKTTPKKADEHDARD